ncbi:MAG: amidase [Promethearchaeota archaeon]
MNEEEICFMSACDMVEKIATQEISSQEITEIFIERIEKINPILNSYCTTTFEIARINAKEADERVKKGEDLPLLNGVPTSIKDLMLTKGVRTTFGCKLYENYIPDVDEIVVERLKNSGMVFIGKTNTPSFGYWPLTDNLIFGPTKNPWDLTKNSGGSSGGAAAQVASGLGPLALGSDGGGSIRVPSSFCGIFGLKPNFGRIPRYPIHDATWINLDHYGPMVRYVKDAALMLDVMVGAADADKYSIVKPTYKFREIVKEKPKSLKIGYSMNLGFVKAIDSEVEKAVMTSIQKFDSFSWESEAIKMRLRNVYKAFATLATAGFAYDLKKYLKDSKDVFEPDLLRMIEAGLGYSAIDYKQAEDIREKLYESFHQLFKKYDILITPSTGVPAITTEERFPSKIGGKSVTPVEWFSFSFPFNLTGLPAASIPCGWSSENLPIGMQIIGRKQDEKTVLQVAKAFEEIAPWQNRKPKL